MKKKLVIPKFKNEDAERAFWAKVDPTKYFEPKDFHRVVAVRAHKKVKHPVDFLTSQITKPLTIDPLTFRHSSKEV